EACCRAQYRVADRGVRGDGEERSRERERAAGRVENSRDVHDRIAGTAGDVDERGARRRLERAARQAEEITGRLELGVVGEDDAGAGADLERATGDGRKAPAPEIEERARATEVEEVDGAELGARDVDQGARTRREA